MPELRRRFRRYLPLFCLGGLALVALGLVAPRVAARRAPARLSLTAQASSMPADGFTWREVIVKASDGRKLNAADLQAEVTPVGLGAISFDQMTGRSVKGKFRPGVLPGTAVAVVRLRGVTAASIRFSLLPEFTDSFRDGTPDFARLHEARDRNSFRRWLVFLADYQAVRPEGQRPAEIKDCAGLLRYAYRGALHAHDETWYEEQKIETPPSINDVEAYHYPATPLGTALFRVRGGSFVPQDLGDHTFAEFADARNLLEFNTHLVSRDARRALPGDLLFFRQLEQSSPFHSMMVTEIGGEPGVVYHTGPNGRKPGEIRRVTMAELQSHPDARWRPVAGNRNFLGVYRWNILREEP